MLILLTLHNISTFAVAQPYKFEYKFLYGSEAEKVKYPVQHSNKMCF